MQKQADEKVRELVLKTGMLNGTRRLIAGVSGGADSVFLFYMMKRICADKNIPFETVHVHHGIRGAEADEDAEYVRSLCKDAEIPFRLIRRDIPSEAAKRKMTLEEAGRYARYEIFRDIASEEPGTKIALAHQKNDVAETMLFQLARGSGLKGLAGIRPVRGIYIRPLLAVTREEEEEWLLRHHISWRTDSTNLSDDASRNRIRHHVLPYLTEHINAQTISHMADAAKIAALSSDFIEAEAQKRYEMYAAEEQTDGFLIRIRDDLVLNEPEIMREEVIRIAVARTLNTLKDVSGLHVRLILELFGRETGKYLNLPKGLIAKKQRGCVALYRTDAYC